MTRITPEFITVLAESEIFVLGSNLKVIIMEERQEKQEINWVQSMDKE